MTTYQSIVKAHLVRMFKSNPLISDTVTFQECERDFITDLALEHGYIPVYGPIAFADYMTVNFIQEQPPC